MYNLLVLLFIMLSYLLNEQTRMNLIATHTLIYKQVRQHVKNMEQNWNFCNCNVSQILSIWMNIMAHFKPVNNIKVLQSIPTR